jgi:CubicO group peptidase (beta-lactamase class C family)
MKKRVIFVVLLFVVVLVGFSGVSSFERYLAKQMRNQEIPAMSVLIFQHSEILYQNYLGKADVERNVALSEDHMFLVASISKVITATALMQLYDKGLFELDDPINDYLDFDVENPYYDEEITFKMLLTHTSSIADIDEDDDTYFYGKDSPVALDSFMKSYLSYGGRYYDEDENYYDFEPGTEYEYSNMGGALVGVLVQELSGQEFNAYCKKNIFKPLNMTNSHWKLSELNINQVVRPYDGDLKPIEHYTFTDYPNGGLRTTARDLFKLLSAYENNGVSGNYRLLSADTVDEMLTPKIQGDDAMVGLHFFRLNKRNELWGHDGGEAGVATIMAFNRKNGVGAIILTNQGDADLDDLLVEAYKTGIELASD